MIMHHDKVFDYEDEIEALETLGADITQSGYLIKARVGLF